MEEIYIIYSAIKQYENGSRSGGPLEIKTPIATSYLGFSSKELAEQFISNKHNDTEAININMLGNSHPAINNNIKHVLVIKNLSELESLQSSKENFDYKGHIKEIIT